VADDLYSLARDLGEIPKETGPFVRKAIEFTARRIKDQIKNDYSGARNLGGASQSISYDLHGSTGYRLGGISAEIGPELGGQGSVVGLVDEGAPRTPGRHRIPKALADNAADFESGLDKAIDDGLKAAGL
jgi:hypothetical protein